jgi:hypothetical protein
MKKEKPYFVDAEGKKTPAFIAWISFLLLAVLVLWAFSALVFFLLGAAQSTLAAWLSAFFILAGALVLLSALRQAGNNVFFYSDRIVRESFFFRKKLWLKNGPYVAFFYYLNGSANQKILRVRLSEKATGKKLFEALPGGYEGEALERWEGALRKAAVEIEISREIKP